MPLQPAPFQPVARQERYELLDALRGLALFGVLLVNLMDGFRISLFQHILGSTPDTGWTGQFINQAIDVLVEFKAFTLFSFLFGVGTAIQAERSAGKPVNLHWFLVRRFAVLLALGLFHVVFIWNGDILMLYGVCGLLLIPFIRARTAFTAILGGVAILLARFVSLPISWPSSEAMRIQAAEATRVYAQGGFLEIFSFRCREAWYFITPLWVSSLPQTFGLMLLGMAAWRSGVLREPKRHRTLLLAILILGAVTGLAVHISGPIPLAFAYASAALLWLPPAQGLAALGRMALSNYLMQSVVMSLVFYGFGLGLFGKLAPLPAAGIAVGLYLAQVEFSRWWLRRFQFGPVEWLWRSLTYGRRQPMVAE